MIYKKKRERRKYRRGYESGGGFNCPVITKSRDRLSLTGSGRKSALTIRCSPVLQLVIEVSNIVAFALVFIEALQHADSLS